MHVSTRAAINSTNNESSPNTHAPGPPSPSLVYGFSTHEMLREVLPYIDRPLGGCASVLVEDRCMAASRQVRTHLGNTSFTSAATSLLCSGRSVGYWVDASSLVGSPCKAWCSSECRYRDFNVSSDAVELRKCLSRRWIHVAGDSTARAVQKSSAERVEMLVLDAQEVTFY